MPETTRTWTFRRKSKARFAASRVLANPTIWPGCGVLRATPLRCITVVLPSVPEGPSRLRTGYGGPPLIRSTVFSALLTRWTYFYLYLILDIFSRYVVGWMVASRESETLAKRLIEETCAKQNIQRDQLTLHADRGSSMASKCVAMLLADLGVTKTHSRPHVSNDNCYSESQFKTLKYCPAFPKRFGSMEDARLFCREFFAWYNTEHRHSGIAWLTPETVHLGQGETVLAARQQVLAEAYREHPERFVRGTPAVSALPEAVWINPPDPQNAQQQLLTNFQTELSHCT